MDPSKRICLKNIPPECTKRDIAMFIRNRTGAQPHSIDLGLDNNGCVRRYAHFSVEGAKNVIHTLTDTSWNGVTVSALPAKPHYTYRLAEARRQRERQEAEERQQREEFCREKTEKWLARTGGELPKGKPPKSFYASRQRYAEIAAEIAKNCREEHKNKRLQWTRTPHTSAEDCVSGGAAQVVPPGGWPSGSPKYNQRSKRKGGAADFFANGVKRRKTEHAAVPPKETRQEEPIKPPPPTKEERKMSGLQAKLAALRAKIGINH
uniref:RRM domain-containing protein n=1 Tax=Trypanosoma congolense (strain IL3000) TaxID=1068625 RepID=G0UWR4_TRYCI|nr:conserved hypothetical protein [Trypanosoma congolense IL3000]